MSSFFAVLAITVFLWLNVAVIARFILASSFYAAHLTIEHQDPFLRHSPLPQRAKLPASKIGAILCR